MIETYSRNVHPEELGGPKPHTYQYGNQVICW
jgi:hypothetical protein